ncbi:MAG: hypothetical protein HETSPECPRED_005697 [Heterodermia speciosa]|uniref:Aminoglycoside phosphotransferase domain-containing protein n=1 Tax=Heterodermia speciosa TaxID=116794 RepID=A0A8H3IEB9_9LECA|nr:MAG: hypothetical protein HETSPECPRED_005697 [Heterodermia speciosa]
MDNFKNIDTAIEDTKRLRQEGSSGAEGNILYLLASGGYNDVWLISPPYQDAERYVLRIPKQGTLLPDQIRNEVAFLTFVKKKLLSVPVPKVLSHSLDGKTWPTPFIAEEFMDGERLSSVWATYDEPTKLAVAHQIAEIIVELAETTSTGIGGLMLEHELGPTVEGMKLSKGRDKFHSPLCYDIGPYTSTKDYVLANYQKEIHYYLYAPEEDIDFSFFEKVSKDAFIMTLQDERYDLLDNDNAFLPEEPFVLVHGDLHGRNILTKGGRVQAVLRWQFAGFYPLSELLGCTGVDVLEVKDDEDKVENNKWSDLIVKLAGERAKSRGWDERKVGLLLGDGDPKLHKTRIEMVPR